MTLEILSQVSKEDVEGFPILMILFFLGFVLQPMAMHCHGGE